MVFLKFTSVERDPVGAVLCSSWPQLGLASPGPKEPAPRKVPSLPYAFWKSGPLPERGPSSSFLSCFKVHTPLEPAHWFPLPALGSSADLLSTDDGQVLVPVNRPHPQLRLVLLLQVLWDDSELSYLPGSGFPQSCHRICTGPKHPEHTLCTPTEDKRRHWSLTGSGRFDGSINFRNWACVLPCVHGFQWERT